MVWGMALPGNFGDFWPSGDFPGWDESLTAYFNNEMPSEEKALFERASSYRYYVAEKLISEPGRKPMHAYPPFSRVAAHEVPKRFKARNTCSSLASFIELPNRIAAVDEALKDLIERFEPGVHYFFPLEILMPSDAIYPKQYFVFIICQYMDSFSPDHSNHDYLMRDGAHGYLIKRESRKEAVSGLTLSRKGFGNAHLWRERYITNVLFCFSDQLISEIDRLGLRVPKHHRMKEL